MSDNFDSSTVQQQGYDPTASSMSRSASSSTMTRSMSRKGLSFSSNNNNNNNNILQNNNNNNNNKVQSSYDLAGMAAEGGRSDSGGAMRRSSSFKKESSSSSFAGSLKAASLARRKVLSRLDPSHAISSSSSSSSKHINRAVKPLGVVPSLSGMGIRSGPSVSAPRMRTTASLQQQQQQQRRLEVLGVAAVEKMNDPYSMVFEAPVVILGKRSLEVREVMHDAAQRESTTTKVTPGVEDSPAKRVHYDQSSPERYQLQNQNARPTMMMESRDRYDSNVNKISSSSSNPFNYGKISPSKGTSGSGGSTMFGAGIRSPERPRPVSPMKDLVSTTTSTSPLRALLLSSPRRDHGSHFPSEISSMPMTRSPFIVLPPSFIDSRLSSASSFSSTLAQQVSLPKRIAPTTLPFRSNVPLSSPASILLPSKYMGSLAPLSPSTSRPSSPVPLTSKSMIPRRVGCNSASAMGEDTTMSDVGNVSMGGGMSEETANKLTKLQAMLSRMSMPRASIGGAIGSSSASAVKRREEGQASRRSTISSFASGRNSSTAILPAALTSTSTARATEGPHAPIVTKSSKMMGEGGATAARRRSTAPSSTLFEGQSDEPARPRFSASTLSSTASSRSSLPARQSMGPPASIGLKRSGTLASISTAAATSSSTSSTSIAADWTAATTKPSRRVSLLPTSSSTSAISALVEINPALQNGATTRKPQNRCLRDVIAYVDIRTLEGHDAGMIFVDLLKDMSAKVATRHTPLITHIVYKSGRPGTLARYRALPDPKPLLVGIGWVVRCAELKSRVDEGPYLVESDGVKEVVVQKRRKSMEPKAIAALSGSTGLSGGLLASDPTLKATITASLDRARRRSLQFCPKVGSPLAKRVFTMMSTEEDDEDEPMDMD